MSSEAQDHPMDGSASEPQPLPNGTPDIVMKEEPETTPAAPLPPMPTPQQQQPQASARASPARGTPVPPPPPQPNPHGSPTRVYLNTNVTPYLLEGVKYLAVYEYVKLLDD